MFCGVVVLYNANEKILDNIRTYIDLLDKLYVIDNSEKLDIILKEKIEDISLKKIVYIFMEGNYGIAKALNIAKNKAIKERKFKWLLTMDQDSKFIDKGFIEMTNYVIQNKFSNIAIYSPFHVIFDKINKKNTISEKEQEVKAVITSGNLLNLEIAEKIGDFNEEFFIDQVDTEYCCRIHLKGYKIVVLKDILLEHKLGEIKSYFFTYSTNHNYIRRYYIARNRCYMIKKYNIKRYFLTIIWENIKIILFEKDKLKKLKMSYLGIKDFFRGITGKINDEYLK